MAELKIAPLRPEAGRNAPARNEACKLDLGWVVQSWLADPNGPEAKNGYVDRTGMPSKDQLLDRYAEVSGRQVDDIDYYEILAKWKLAVVLEQGYQRRGDDPGGGQFRVVFQVSSPTVK